MFKYISTYLHDFLKRDGSSIFIATLISRLLSFAGSWVALMLLPSKELGLVIYAFSIISFLIPLGGLGAEQSLLRFGSLLSNNNEKASLYHITLFKGIKWSIVVIIVAIIFSPVFTYKLQESFLFFILLTFSILSYFLFEILKINYRIIYNNKMFALMDITFSAIQILSILILSFVFGIYGYIASLTLSPLITYLIFRPVKLNIPTYNFNFINKDFWKYGFSAGLSNVATQLLFAIDIILIGYLLIDPQLVTYYKYVSIIPFSLLVLPNIMITTDFVSITENINNLNFIKRYIKNFMLLFSILSILILLITIPFGKNILGIFGTNYTSHYNLFLILTFGVIGIFTLRSLFGNLLSAMGMAYLNYWIACASLILNVILNYYFIPTYGILGAGMTSAIVMWLSGILSMILFFMLYKKNKKLL